MPNLYDFTATRIDGTQESLSNYKDKVVLIVNVASQCGFTPQYTGLEELYQEFEPLGFTVLGFPCNQFGHQEPGSNASIQNFCEVNFGVSFPLYAKIDVNGATADPLFVWLKQEAKGLLGSSLIKWNFTKFLISRSGTVHKRYAPATTPAQIKVDIRSLLES